MKLTLSLFPLLQALVTNKSPPTHSPPAPPPPPITSASSLVPHATPPSSAPPSYATWERTSSGGVGPAGVPPPLSSAPPVGLTTPPGAGGGASKGPVKSSMQQLQRQLSAGQSSIQSFSGKPLLSCYSSAGKGICSDSWVGLTFMLAVPTCAWADMKLAELAEQLGKMVEHQRSKSTQPINPSRCPTLYLQC